MGETIASEMVARLDIMVKDVQMLTKKVRTTRNMTVVYSKLVRVIL